MAMNIYGQYIRPIARDVFLRMAGSFSKPSPGIHILNGHYVTPYKPDLNRDWKIMDDFLATLSNMSEFLRIEEAIRLISSNQIPTDKCYVSFTYDDGYAECYTTIAPLLEKYGTNAAFFLNANYISSSIEYQKEFNKRVAMNVKSPLTWAQVVEMHQGGHVIGAHTLDHVRVSNLSKEEYEYQLKENKRLLEEHLYAPCDYFAWTYGNFKDFPQSAISITKQYHSTIFSADNCKHYHSFGDKQVFNRRHIEAFWPTSHIKYFLSSHIKS